MQITSLLKVKTLQYMVFALSLSVTTDSYATMPNWSKDVEKWQGGVVHENTAQNSDYDAVAPTACPQITPENILKYANDPTAAAEFDKNWNVTRTNITISKLKEGDIFSPKVECLGDGRRRISYKVKVGNIYHEQEAIVSPRKLPTKN